MAKASARGNASTRSTRQLRVGEEIRHALSDVLRRGDFHDPELEKHNISITEVRVSPDLKNATAFVMSLGGDQQDDMLAALKHASKYLRGQVARSINLKHAPRLSFQLDTAFDHADNINAIFQDPRVAGDLDNHDDEDEA